jgi:metal iron transporter
MIVAVAVGRPGINALLVISQVILSIVLPFITFPLIYLTSSKSIMRVRKPQPSPTTPGTDTESGEAWKDFSNSKFTMGLGYAIWLVVLTANMYVIVLLGMGKSG